MSEPLTARDEEALTPGSVRASRSTAMPATTHFATKVIGGEDDEAPSPGAAPSKVPVQGRVLGTFRNTYYDFPTEADYGGESVALRDAKCGAIAQVPRPFHDAVCVQGSGILKTGRTVSFAKRDCDCAEICPKTGQKICFEALDPLKFPWGRGALGSAITPFMTIAVDDAIVPMGTPVFIPELVGMPTEPNGGGKHDGCFIAQDRGLRVKGQHVDIFTGYSAMTALWNRIVPSNQGVTVVLDEPRCARADIPQ
jgi:3D (Asp-Asp-Asp) domain-containing protein